MSLDELDGPGDEPNFDLFGSFGNRRQNNFPFVAVE